MDEKYNGSLDQVERVATTQSDLHVLQAQGDVKNAKVASVALTDAMTKDQPSAWSWSMIRLYGIMLLVTMSKSHTCPPNREALWLSTPRRLHERVRRLAHGLDQRHEAMAYLLRHRHGGIRHRPRLRHLQRRQHPRLSLRCSRL